MPSPTYIRQRAAELASYRAALLAGKIHVIRVTAGYGETTLAEVHDRDCPCLSCSPKETV